MSPHMFSLDAQKCGFERHIRAERECLGITVYRDEDPVRASSASDAIRIARDYIGSFLQPAQRGGVPWGLRLTVSDGVAVYGDWPLSGGGSGGSGFQNTPLVRIRNRWHDSGPLSALENAAQIIRAYAGDTKARAA